MNFSEDFFLKNRLAVMKISRDFFIMELGQQIPTIAEYIQRFSLSRGTIQAALAFLMEQDCIKTQFKGHLGSFLVYKNPGKLWELTGFGTFTGAMPLPLGSLLAGLATGICDCMKQMQIDFNCVFIQGSRTRLNGLARNRYDFMIASKLTAQTMMKEYPNIEIVMQLRDCMYAGKYTIMFAKPTYTEITDGMTIAVDCSSVDQAYLTNLVCQNKKVHLLELAYINTARSVAEGTADAVISRQDAVQRSYPQMPCRDLVLSDYSTQQIGEFSNTVVLAEKDNYGVKSLLNWVLDASDIARKQRMVMEGTAPENYY